MSRRDKGSTTGSVGLFTKISPRLTKTGPGVFPPIVGPTDDGPMHPSSNVERGAQTPSDDTAEDAAIPSISDVVTAVSLRLAGASDDELDAAIDESLRAIGEHESADRAHITKYLDGGTFTNSHEWVAPGLPSHRPAIALRHIDEFPYSVHKVFAGEVWHAPDLRAEPEEATPEKESFGAFGVQSVLQVPIRTAGVIVGCIGFNHVQSTREWSDEAIELVRRVGDAIGMALARRDATRALREARDEAERANTAKDEFLSRISHELRTPLNAVLGFAELLVMDEDRPNQKAALEQILSSGRHLLELVEDVLDVSRMSSGSMVIALSDVPLSVAVARAVGALRPLSTQRDVQIIVSPMAPRLSVLADPGRLHQVLMHLLTNAVKYNHAGGSVWISGSLDESHVTLEIRDDGVGIGPDQLERVWEPFERAGAERTQTAGSGIGLTLSKMLVETMGGTIALDSLLGLGTTVRVQLRSAQGDH